MPAATPPSSGGTKATEVQVDVDDADDDDNKNSLGTTTTSLPSSKSSASPAVPSPPNAMSLVVRAVLMVLALALMRVLGLPSLWEAYPHLQPEALSCPSSGGGKGAALDAAAAARFCGGVARTYLANIAMNTNNLSETLHRQRIRPPTLTQARAVARCLGHWAPASPQSSICYIVRTGSDAPSRELAAMIRQTWGRLVQTVWYVSDQAEEELGTITFPGIAGKSASDEDAEHRMLLGFQKIVNSSEASHCKWFWAAADNSFANPVELAALTEGLSSDFPVSFSWTWWRQGFTGLVTCPSGGSMFSRAGALAVGAALYTEACPFTKSADLSFGVCNAATSTMNIHTLLFDPLAVQAPGGEWLYMQEQQQSGWASLFHLSTAQIKGLYEVFRFQYGLDLDGNQFGDVLTDFDGVDSTPENAPGAFGRV
jgi:hypothetical protein